MEPNIRKEDETIPVTVPLTPLDHEEIHAKMIEHNGKRDKLESQINDFKAAIKAAQKEVDTLNEHIYACITNIEHGEKTVSMECLRVTDYDAGTVSWLSKDTGEVVKERDLTDDERQMSMDFDDTEESPDYDGQFESESETDISEPLPFEPKKRRSHAAH